MGLEKIKKAEAMHLCAWNWRRIKKRRAPACMGLEKNKKAEGAYVHGISVQRTI
jgi:hypothetical protein